jgi:hypothetical protein
MKLIDGVPDVQSLKEVNLEFMAIESCVFSLDQKSALTDLFAPDVPSSQLQWCTTEMARKVQYVT